MSLNAEQLTWMRAHSLSSLPDLCTIKRPTDSSDAWGEGSSSYADAHPNVACSYGVTTGSERFAGETQTVAMGTPVVTMPAGTDVRVRDRLVVAARGLSPAHTVEVTAVLRTTDELMVRAIGTEGTT